MLRNVNKQSEKSMQLVLKKKRKTIVGRICRKEGFKPFAEPSQHITGGK